MDTLFSARCVLALAALALAAGPARGASLRAAGTISFGNVTVRERVGSLDLSFRGRWLAPGETASAEFRSPGKPYALLLRTVVSDDLPGHTVAYSVEVNGEVCGRRELRTEGVGRRSQFVRIDDRGIYSQRTQRLAVRNTAREKLFVESALVLPGYLDAIRQPFDDSDFVLAFLINGARAGHADLKRIKDFRAAPGVTRAISSEVPFAVANREGLKKRIDEFADAVAEAGWPAVPIPISWWAGTPSEIRERLDFQQVCYSKTDNYDEGQGLKDLLGDRWRIEYGLTTPNVWSNTPWATMNSPGLNALRRQRLDDIMPYLLGKLGGSAIAYITENEPMYWAGMFPDGNYPVKRDDLLADFNPGTVADAAKDGVTLDPTDGLDMTERLWLFGNLNRYLAATSGWIAAHTKSVPVYTHALLEDHFPMKDSGRARPAMEAAVAPPRPTGVETLWDTNMDKYRRLREWGPWGCVNREEGDSRPISQHIGMALALYAMGADMLNSYNWQSIQPPERCDEYFNGFTSRLPESLVCGDAQDAAVTGWKAGGRFVWKAGADPDMPWGTRLSVKVRNLAARQAVLTLSVFGSADGALAGYCRKSVPAGADGWVDLELDSVTDAAQHRDLVFDLRAAEGVTVAFAGDRPLYRWTLNCAEERWRSRIIRDLR